MRVRVLGSAAGGGFPQWNCGCPNCSAVRAGDPRYLSRTQDSVVVSADGQSWTLVNASPDVLRQIESFPALHPRASRHSPIGAIVLTNGDLDHVLGLFSLRESQPLVIFSTARVWKGLMEGNAIGRTLQRFEGQVSWKRMVLDEAAPIAKGLSVTPFSVPGKLPVHLMGSLPPDPEDNVGVRIGAPDSAGLVYISGAAGPGDYLGKIDGAEALFFDATFWSSDELVELGLSRARAEEMAHWPLGGPGGSLAALGKRAARRRILTHINNSNPILQKDSPERRAAESAGWEVAFDGLEVLW